MLLADTNQSTTKELTISVPEALALISELSIAVAKSMAKPGNFASFDVPITMETKEENANGIKICRERDGVLNITVGE